MAIAPKSENGKRTAARDLQSKRKREARIWFVAGLVCGALAAAVPAFAAPGPRINHVPDEIGPNTRKIYPSAKENNHILIVNVDNAIAPEVFATTVTYAMSRINVNTWTNSLSTSVVAELIERPERQKELLGEKAKVAVFLEKREGAVSFLNAPGRWAMVNVSALDDDSPSEQTLKDRYAKTILKGVGYACGIGASVEELCSLNYESATLQGMDRTDIRISPMAYFPMLSILQSIGGIEMMSPPYE